MFSCLASVVMCSLLCVSCHIALVLVSLFMILDLTLYILFVFYSSHNLHLHLCLVCGTKTCYGTWTLQPTIHHNVYKKLNLKVLNRHLRLIYVNVILDHLCTFMTEKYFEPTFKSCTDTIPRL